jgi:F-type H+-transporting ATPase subunit c
MGHLMKALRNVWLVVGSFVLFLTGNVAFAQEAAAAASGVSIGLGIGIVGLAIAAIGGAFGQGKAAVAALEGIARNPSASSKIFVPMIIALALIESLVLYVFVVAILKL